MVLVLGGRGNPDGKRKEVPQEEVDSVYDKGYMKAVGALSDASMSTRALTCYMYMVVRNCFKFCMVIVVVSNLKGATEREAGSPQQPLGQESA